MLWNDWLFTSITGGINASPKKKGRRMSINTDVNKAKYCDFEDYSMPHKSKYHGHRCYHKKKKMMKKTKKLSFGGRQRFSCCVLTIVAYPSSVGETTYSGMIGC